MVTAFSGPDLNDVIIGGTIFAGIALYLRRENPHWPWPHILFRAFLVCVVGVAKVCFAFWILDPVKHSVDVNVFDPAFRRIPEWIQIVGFASLLVAYAWMVSYGLWKRRETEKRGPGREPRKG